ncbi:putative holin-like toxin [Phascolarctobacterium succinatutens]|nr:MAG TPA_asm: Putative Holin-like Toxin (Hol-Tox) [Caudoviricetes sp.]DAL39003.1 MAG TPA_asm: Putative Holin-like Toxin (Hol-Tox) [Bacteriophage sp.]DAV72093.1 MAG TPA: Putative Holin-like Toxin (Hol-Tox) [Caudoviricetes sp.]
MSGGDVMTVFEALSLMIAFATLVVLILSYRK